MHTHLCMHTGTELTVDTKYLPRLFTLWFLSQGLSLNLEPPSSGDSPVSASPGLGL